MKSVEFLRKEGWELSFDYPLRYTDCEGQEVCICSETNITEFLFRFDKFCLKDFVKFLNEFPEVCVSGKRKFYTEDFVKNHFRKKFTNNIPKDFCLKYSSDFCKVYYRPNLYNWQPSC